MKSDSHLPSSLPSIDGPLRILVLCMLFIALAMPVLNDKPWQEAVNFWDKKIAPHFGSNKTSK